MLYKDGEMVKTLDIETLEELRAKGEIDWPMVKQKEIEDRSKGDFLSKSIAVLQTTWFMVQCLARGVARITLTQMELTTLAFCVLNIILCILWWKKPLAVTYPFPVYLRGSSPLNTPTLRSSSLHSFDQPSPLKRCRAYFCQRFREKGLFAPIYIFIIEPFIVAWSSASDLITCETIPGGAPQFRVPTFYAPGSPYDMLAIFMGLCVGITFGGIHCVGWSFGFPTVQEEYVWRTGAATITAIPLFLFVIVENVRMQTGDAYFHYFSVIRSLAVYLSIVLYCVSRAALLVLPLSALRSLPPGALVDFNWTSLIPHM